MHDLTPRWPRWVLGLVATLLLPLLATFSTPSPPAGGDPAAGWLHPDWYLPPGATRAFWRPLAAASWSASPPCCWGTLVLVPTVLVVAYYFPGWILDEPLDPAPFAVPPVVSVGLLQIYADGVLPFHYRHAVDPDRGPGSPWCSPSCTGRWPTACKGCR